MRVVLQRVQYASVTIDNTIKDQIGKGLLLLLGIETQDDETDVDWLCKKIAALRIFNDDADKMNLSVKDVQGEILVISQFTLYGQSPKGNRPSFIRAARPEKAIPLYELFLQRIAAELGKPVGSGEFGADMKVALLNDGPVTLVLDSRQRDF